MSLSLFIKLQLLLASDNNNIVTQLNNYDVRCNYIRVKSIRNTHN